MTSFLATLLLLSNAKLLHTIIATVSFTTLTDGGERSTFTVWLADGWRMAIPSSYIKWPHTTLFLASALAFLLYLYYHSCFWLYPYKIGPNIKPCIRITGLNHCTYQGPYIKQAQVLDWVDAGCSCWAFHRHCCKCIR